MTQENDVLLTVAEVAALVRRCEKTVRRRIQNGHLPAMLEGQRYLISTSDLAAYLAALRAGGDDEPDVPPCPRQS